MSQLESTKQLNALKQSCIKRGGYNKHKAVLLNACKMHLDLFGVDLTPAQLK